MARLSRGRNTRVGKEEPEIIQKDGEMLAKLFRFERGSNEMFLNVLDEPRQILLRKLTDLSPVPESYLAGGTALALMFGHRQSVDFDWFTPVKFDPAELAARLSEIGNVRIAETRSGPKCEHELLSHDQKSRLF